MDWVTDYSKEFRARLVNETGSKIWGRNVYNMLDELTVLIRWVEDPQHENGRKTLISLFKGIKI